MKRYLILFLFLYTSLHAGIVYDSTHDQYRSTQEIFYNFKAYDELYRKTYGMQLNGEFLWKVIQDYLRSTLYYTEALLLYEDLQEEECGGIKEGNDD